MLDSTAYFYMKSWHIPAYEGLTPKLDYWLKLPANIIVSGGRFHVTAMDTRVVSHNLMTIRSDGMLVAVRRGRPGIIITPTQLQRIESEALDVSEWEKALSKTWNYGDMFDAMQVESRFAAQFGADRTKYYLATADSAVFNEIYNNTKVQPCQSCGRKR